MTLRGRFVGIAGSVGVGIAAVVGGVDLVSARLARLDAVVADAEAQQAVVEALRADAQALVYTTVGHAFLGLPAAAREGAVHQLELDVARTDDPALRGLAATLVAESADVVDLAGHDDVDGAHEAATVMADVVAGQRLAARLTTVGDAARADAEAARVAAGDARFVLQGFVAFVSTSVLLVVAALGWQLWRSVLRGTTTLAEAAERIGRGERCVQVPYGLGDELAEVASAFNTMSLQVAQVAQLRAASEAAIEASRLKSEFLANVSHEIRTPMNGVIGLADLLAATPLPPEPAEHVRLLQISASQLLGLINEVLDFTKLESGKDPVSARDFSLARSLGDVVRTLAVRARPDVEVVQRIASGVPDALTGDDQKLRQIVTNLVYNAIKFTEQGEVVVDVDVDELTADTVLLHVCVRDTGIGIDPSRHGEIFEAFAQADGSVSRRHGGTGLGLTIASRLVALLNGRIWVDSTPGEGSAFHFTAEMRTRRTVTEPEQLAGIRILVVDDNVTARTTIAQALRAAGARVQVAEGLETALRVAREAETAIRPITVAVVDADLGDDDGAEVLAQLRGLKEPPLGVLLVSPNRGPDQSARASGAAAFRSKPVVGAELVETILGLVRPVEPALLLTPPRMRVLAAEDNPINQHLLSRILLRRGHELVLVGDGAAAIERYDEGFDVVLMDVQMPGVDGYTATAAIRAKEAATGRRVPIIAMTAHAMPGDREKCLLAGMDDYLPKPIHIDEFVALLERHAPARSGTAARPATEPAIDRKLGLDLTHGDVGVFRELAALFRDEGPRALARVEAALAERNYMELDRAAHTLKTSVGILGARAAYECAAAVEQAARDGRIDDAPGLVEALRVELERVLGDTDRIVGEEAA